MTRESGPIGHSRTGPVERGFLPGGTLISYMQIRGDFLNGLNKINQGDPHNEHRQSQLRFDPKRKRHACDSIEWKVKLVSVRDGGHLVEKVE